MYSFIFMFYWKDFYFIKNEEVSARIDKMKVTIPIFILLQAMGLTMKKILYTLGSKVVDFDDSQVSKALHNLNKLVLGSAKDLNVLWFKFKIELNNFKILKLVS